MAWHVGAPTPSIWCKISPTLQSNNVSLDRGPQVSQLQGLKLSERRQERFGGVASGLAVALGITILHPLFILRPMDPWKKWNPRELYSVADNLSINSTPHPSPTLLLLDDVTKCATIGWRERQTHQSHRRDALLLLHTALVKSTVNWVVKSGISPSTFGGQLLEEEEEER